MSGSHQLAAGSRDSREREQPRGTAPPSRGSFLITLAAVLDPAGIWRDANPYTRLRKALGWLVFFVLVFFAGVTVYEAGPYHTFGLDWGSPEHRTDYTVYYDAGLAVMQHLDIYAVRSIRGWAYVYPPPFSIAMVPLSLLPLPLSMLIFYGICAGLMVWAVAMSARVAQPQPATAQNKLEMIALPILLTFVWFGHGLARGQASVLVAWMVIAGVYWERRGKTAAAACSLAGGILLKTFPLSLLAYYAWRGKWKFVGATLTAVVVGLLLLPATVFGWHGNLNYLLEFKRTVVDPATLSEAARSHYDLYDQLLSLGKPRNNALAPVLYRLFGGEQTPIISVLIAAILGVVIWLVARRAGLRARFGSAARREETPMAQRAEPLILGAMVTWTLLISPVAEDHYYALMLLPAAFAVAGVITAQGTPARVGRWALVAYGVLNFSGVFGHAFEYYGVVCWAGVVMWLLLLYLAATRSAPSAAADARAGTV